MGRILNALKLRKQTFILLAGLYVMTLLLLTSHTNMLENNDVTVVTSRRTLDVGDEQDSAAEFVDDLLRTTGSRNENDIVQHGRRLAAQLIGNNDETTGSESVTSEADERLERLSRVMELARYQLEDSARRKRMKPMVRTLQDVVDKMKRQKAVEQPTRNIKLNIHQHDENTTLPAWKRFHNSIDATSLYSDNDDVISDLLDDLRTLPLERIYELDRATQMHLLYRLKDRSQALFKPKRVERNFERPVDLEVYYDLERHTAEIAAFHLDSKILESQIEISDSQVYRVLGFRRVPPAVGRKLHILDEIGIFSSNSTTGLMYDSIGGHICFNGMCYANCDDNHPICADEKDQLEGSMIAIFPIWLTTVIENPYCAICSNCTPEVAQSQYEKRFSVNSDYCAAEVRQTWPFHHEKSLLHLVDAHLFDFFTGNLDRHHLNIFDEHLGEDSFMTLFDNGKGFATSQRDEIILLAPLYQCCMVRLSTVDRLLALYAGPDRLSDVMRQSLESDLLDSVLTEAHLAALDRRLSIVLEYIYQCIHNNSQQPVVIDDQF